MSCSFEIYRFLTTIGIHFFYYFFIVQYLIQQIRPICESSGCSELITAALHWHTLPEPNRLGLLSVKQTTKRTSSMKMLVIGGNESFDVITMESYCPRSKKWLTGDQFKCPMKLYESRLAVINKKVYVTGKKVSSNYKLMKMTPRRSRCECN